MSISAIFLFTMEYGAFFLSFLFSHLFFYFSLFLNLYLFFYKKNASLIAHYGDAASFHHD